MRLLRALVLAFAVFAIGTAGHAVLPDAAKPKSAAKAGSSPAQLARESEAQHRDMEQCIAAIAEVRKAVAEKCVLAGGVCYDKSGCELQADGRYRCTTVNTELTQRYEKTMARPCK